MQTLYKYLYRRDAALQRLTANATVVNLIPSLGNELFSFLRSGNSTMRGVKFHWSNSKYYNIKFPLSTLLRDKV